MTDPTLSNAPAPGDILAGKYRVDRVLGAGSAGIVVAATHLDLGERRALKLLRPELGGTQAAARFLREARALVKLQSEHVVRVFDVGRLESGVPYMVMELLEGEDLAELVSRRGPLPAEEAALYVHQAASALVEAHALGIVHRDLKPANLFLTRRRDGSPCVKVIDFGVSKRMHGDAHVHEGDMTHPGDVMGSPLYMAPEQMRSAREADARSDVWALGTILYKLVTGKAPFTAPTVAEVFMAVLSETPAARASSHVPGLSPALDALLACCLEKDPARRLPSADALRGALAPFLRQSVPPNSCDDEAHPLNRTIPLVAPPRRVTPLGTQLLPPVPASISSPLPPPLQPRPSLPSFHLSPPPLPPRAPMPSTLAPSPEQVSAAIASSDATTLERRAQHRRRRTLLAAAGATTFLLLAATIALIAYRSSPTRAQQAAAFHAPSSM